MNIGNKHVMKLGVSYLGENRSLETLGPRSSVWFCYKAEPDAAPYAI